MVEISEIQEGDKAELRRLELRLFKEYLKKSKAISWEDLSQDLIDQLGASGEDAFDFYMNGGLSFVAREDGMIVGFIFAQQMRYVQSLKKVVWIENMGVHPDYRRQGIAVLLIRKLVQESKEKGADAVLSSVTLDNRESIMLHARLGFLMDDRKFALLDLESADF
ncbi:MAG TPA: GNAT family N-acetyltransferase [Methanomassiliicoccales archaeon]|nr:GNAT family N-acetyltransferase [Methanomassiliicoccales archaeon]